MGSTGLKASCGTEIKVGDTFTFTEDGIKLVEEWRKNSPPHNILLNILCDDFRGEYESEAIYKPYKKPKAGQCKKGFRKGARWVWPNGDALTRKELPSAWRKI